MNRHRLFSIHFLRQTWSAALLGAGLLTCPLAWGQQAAFEVRATVGGQERDFEASENEVQVVRKGDHPADELRKVLRGGLPGAVIEGHNPTHAIVRLPKAFDHAKAGLREDEISRLMPDAEVQPVLYPKGQPHTEKNRHFATRDILVKVPAGKTAAQLVATAGAQSSRATVLDGYALLRFADAYKALAGAKTLREGGAEVRPQLARMQSLRTSAPKDEFFSEQWHLFNIGQGGGKPGIDANVLGAWDITLGKDINISIVDNGLQTNHPDLRENCPDIQTGLHHDFNDDDADPRPAVNDNHGTAVGGVAAARQNNGNINPANGSLLGVSGSAPEAQLIGLRLIAAPTTDQEEADALFWNPPNFSIGISNNSWGPFDGSGVHAPDVLTKAALALATSEGRNGKGQVTVFASGNGNQIFPNFFDPPYPDNSNYDGYANSRFVLAVGAVDNLGVQAIYSEPGANLMVVGPSNGGTLGVTTTDQTGVRGYNPAGPGNLPNTDYTNDFGGTSSAAPLAAGGVALMLSASGDTLGWRDVKEILAGTARQIDPGDPDWITNGGGFRFNHKYGGGMIDLRAAVTRAITWNNLGTETSQTIAVPAKQVPVNIPDGPVGMVTKTFDFSTLPNLRLEQIEVIVDITHPRRSDLTITITSPGGVVSVLAKQHPHPDIVFTGDDDQDYKDNGLGWTFTSTHCWGDNSIKGTNGVWTLAIKDEGSTNAFTGILNAASVRLWGTVAPQSRVIFDGASYSLSESQVPDPQNPGQFINARQTIRIKRLGPLDSEATVDYATTVGTATFPGNQGGLPPDFTPVAGTAHFSQGQAFADANISVEILPDNEPEPSEQINLVLNNPIGASLGGVTLATIDILDSSQNSVSIAATDNTASETNVDVPVDWATFTISRLTATASPLTVHFNVTGTATFNDGVALEPDYQPIAVEATIPAFATSVNLVIRPLNDQAIEGVETVIISLESDPAYAIGAVSSAQINIVDNDRQKVQLVNLDNQADEINPANTGHLRLIRSVDISAANAFDKPLSVDLSLAGTQHPRDNYTLIVGSEMRPLGPETTAFTVEIPAGLTTLDFFIVPVDDSVYEATKTVVVGLRPNPNYDSSFGFLTSSIVRIVEDDPLPDTAIPKVRITSPTDGQRFLRTDPFTLTASGTARDNTNVQRVFVRVNDRPAQLATLATPDPTKPNIVTWSLNITSELMLGKNVMTVQARDGDLNNFNDSALETVRFTYIERHNLTVNIDGAGDVTPAYRGTTLQKAGDTLKIVATPAPGNVFAGWFSDTPVPNTLISPSRKLLFMMPANPTGAATLRAKFITSPFTEQIAGNYSGLVQAPIFNFDTSGFLAVKVSGTGAFSGKLNFAGKVLPLIGEFTVGNGGNATYSGLVQRGNNLAPLALGLTIDTNPNGTQRITGTVNSGPVSSEVAADRAAYGKTVPAPSTLTHDYTIYMPPAAPLADPSKDPHGMGVGTVKIDARGVVRWKGRLADRTVVSQTASLTKANTWPLFLSLYERKGIMLGTVTHEGVQPPNNLTAIVDWFRPIIGKGNFPLGFKIVDARVFGAIYNAPDADSRVLSSFDTAPDNKGTITIDEGNILSPVSAQFLLNLKNKVKFDLPNPRAIEIVIDPVTGKFTGSFIHPISLKKTAMEGIVFQTLTGPDQQMIGTFLGKSQSGVPNQTGRIFLKANTAVGP